MNFIIFDVETTGRPTREHPVTRMISLAWTVADISGNMISNHYYLIRPDGWSIPKDSFWADHGYTQADSLAKGKSAVEVLKLFLGDLQSSSYQIAHNIAYDIRIINAEIDYAKIQFEKALNRICTMYSSSRYCNLKNAKGGLKPPTLSELYSFLFKKELENAHHAGHDVNNCKDIFFELMRLGIIRINSEEILV